MDNNIRKAFLLWLGFTRNARGRNTLRPRLSMLLAAQCRAEYYPRHTAWLSRARATIQTGRCMRFMRESYNNAGLHYMLLTRQPPSVSTDYLLSGKGSSQLFNADSFTDQRCMNNRNDHLVSMNMHGTL